MRKPFVIASSALVLVVLSVPHLLAMLLWPTRTWRIRTATHFARWWSRATLRLAGVRLEVHHRERLRQVPAVFLFNHTSSLDFFVNSTLANPRCLVFGKRELARVPLLGWIWFLSGHPMIKRHDRGQWQRLLDAVEARVATGEWATFIAPEGSRSKDGRLREFKKGPFHVAIGARAPIVPIVLHGVADLFVREETRVRWRTGTVRVDVLAPIPTDAWSEATIDDHVAEVRRVYAEALGQVEEAAARGE